MSTDLAIAAPDPAPDHVPAPDPAPEPGSPPASPSPGTDPAPPESGRRRLSRRDRERVSALMAALAAGDTRAVFALVDEFGAHLASCVRRHLRSFGRRDLLGRPEDVDYLVMSAALVLLERAAGWTPGGALPWTWADKAIRSAVGAEIGHATLPFEEVAPYGHRGWLRREHAVVVDGGDALDDLRGLAQDRPLMGLLVELIEAEGSERDQQVHVQYGIQKGLEDPSPAHTVGRLFGLRPDHVRQIDRRMRLRLTRRALSDERYAPLLDLAWLGPEAAGHQSPAGAPSRADAAAGAARTR